MDGHEDSGGVEVAVTEGRTQVPESPDPGSVALDAYVAAKTLTFQEAVQKYDVVQAVYDPQMPFVIMADRNKGAATQDGSLVEIGFSSASPWTAWTRRENNTELRDKMGLQQYYNMKRSDGAVRGMLRYVKTPIQSAHWFIEPGSDSDRDKKIAEFVWEAFDCYLNVAWSCIVDQILLMCEYGYMVFEKVWKFTDDGQLVLQKLGPRHPLDIQSWLYDANGGPDGIKMEPNPMMGDPTGVEIPISKLICFTLEGEAGDMSGISLLRSAWKHWYYKDTLYKIDAIQKERHGIGIPIIKLPPNWSKADRTIAEELGRNLRTNERAHVILPPNWDLIFAKLEGQPVDCLSSIQHHNHQIFAQILAPFAEEPKLDPKSLDLYYKSVRYIADTICDVINKFIIPQLVDFNFVLGSKRKYPKLRARRIGEWEDARTMSFTLRNLVGAGLVTADDPTEIALRRDLDLPPMDKATARIVATPQGADANVPAKPEPSPAELPRQAKPSANPPQKNSGRDSSGG